MPDLHDRLAQLAADARWPPTPDLAPSVRAAIETARGPVPRWRAAIESARGLVLRRGTAIEPARERVSRRRARSHSRRRPLLAALLALVVGGTLAAPGVGSGLLERLGLKSATVTQVRRLPPAALGGRLALGERTTLADARRAAGHDLLRPAALGAPAEVYVDGDVVAFVYRARSGQPILFTQVPGSTRNYIEKIVTQRTRHVRIGGRPGLFLRGRHVVMFEGRSGGTRVEESRLAKNTLMWERGELLLRLEADEPVGELLRIARSVG
jgi:hypothetical protein